MLKQAQIIFGQPGLREIAQCENLHWIQMSWAGTDIYTARNGFPREVALTNASGCFHIVIPEYVDCSAAGTLQKSETYQYSNREKMESDPFRDASLWKAGTDSRCRRYWDLRGRTALCVRCQNNRMRKTDRNYPDCYDGMITPDERDLELQKADIVINCLPGTAATKGLLNKHRLCLMKEKAFLVNVGKRKCD